MRINKIVSGIVILVVIGVGAWFYENSNKTPTLNTDRGSRSEESSVVETVVPAENSSGTIEAGVVKEFLITGKNFSFVPSAITVSKGDRVKITFKNEDGFHDFKIDEYNIATPKIQGGNESAVEFTADKAGSFEYYCSVGSHRSMGMYGTLVVK